MREEITMAYDKDREVREAIDAGEQALRSLKTAREKLNSAGNWGLLDIFGGDTISGLMKHKKIGDAERYIDDAKRDLRYFSRELGDIRGIENMNIDVGGFLTFADFFFDGFLADVMVQSKINNAKRQVDEAIRRVENVLKRLRAL